MGNMKFSIDADLLIIVGYLLQRQDNNLQLRMRVETLKNIHDELKPRDVAKHIVYLAMSSLRPSERNALIGWVVEDIRPANKELQFLGEHGFILGPRWRVHRLVRKRCHLLYIKEDIQKLRKQQ